MISDDTEHAIFVAQALLHSSGDPIQFQRLLGWHLRWWLLRVPAGIGLATLRSIMKLWLGFPPGRSGVCSAGNGPAMRSPLIGAYYAHDPAMLEQFVRASTLLTHSDPKALVGALAVALVAAWCVRNGGKTPDAEELFSVLHRLDSGDEWTRLLDAMRNHLASNGSVETFARSLGNKGVSGYIFCTVPVAIYAWLRHHNDFESGLKAALNCGGDTDTVGAITGALLGLSAGDETIPKAWLDDIGEWPYSTSFMSHLADLLAASNGFRREHAVVVIWPALVARNFLFLLVVLVHGFRRLLPPY